MTTFLSVVFCIFSTNAFLKDEFKWAFSQNIDKSFPKNEVCRESLAKSIYLSSNKDKITKGSDSNVFIFKGSVESYRIVAFKTQAECETVLTNLILRKNL